MKTTTKLILALILVTLFIPSALALRETFSWTMADNFADGHCSSYWKLCYTRSYYKSCGRGGCDTKGWRCGYAANIVANPTTTYRDRNQNRTGSCDSMCLGEECLVEWTDSGDWAGTGGPQDTPPIGFVDDVDTMYSGYSDLGVGVPSEHMHSTASTLEHWESDYSADFDVYLGVACDTEHLLSVCKVVGVDCIEDQGVIWLSTSEPQRVKFTEPGTYEMTYTVPYTCQMDASTYDKCHRAKNDDYNYYKRTDTATETRVINVLDCNQPPTEPDVEVTPDSACESDDLTCTITTESTDPDGDAVTYTYMWYKDGGLMGGLTLEDTTHLAYSISAALTRTGETWRCTVTPKDERGLEGSTALDETTVIECGETCDDGIDNDGDGLIDCLDPDCCADPACPYDDDVNSEGANGGLCCANSLDDDNDGDIDAADFDCQEGPPPTPANCDDGLDNDGDTLVDCDDPDCCADPACPYDDDVNSEGANGGLCCANSLDDDNDGDIDAADFDCQTNDCTCDSSTPDICETDPWKAANCVSGCEVNDGVDDPRGTGPGVCVDCADFSCPTSSDDECPYNCHCDDATLGCGSGPSPNPEDSCHFVTCDGDPGCNSGCIGPCAAPNLQCCPIGFRTCACMELCPSVYYGGAFTTLTATAETHIFPVIFTDYSTEPTVSWTFDLVEASEDCMVAELSMPDGNPFNIPKDGTETVGQLMMQTTAGNVCLVTLSATAGGTTVEGVYILDFGSFPPIAPGVQIPEIPVVIHPLSIYSQSPADAESELIRAQDAVDALDLECASGCSSGVQAKLNEAKIHLSAARRYLGTCSASGGATCGLSQYYSNRALQLANEGQGLL